MTGSRRVPAGDLPARANYAQRILTVYREDLDGLPEGIAAEILGSWRDLADYPSVPCCPHVADPHARHERDDRLDGGIFTCARHPSAGLTCPGCMGTHLTHARNDHRRCRRCDARLDPFSHRPVRVAVDMDLAHRDGSPAGTLGGGTLRTVGWEFHRTCHSRPYDRG